MARSRGVSNYSGNFEVKIQGALDARLLVPTKAELLLDATWKNSGLEYTYLGMIVSVYNDGTNNGVYRLNATDYTNSANWDKLGASGDVISLSTALSTETSLRTSADSSLTSAVSTVSAGLSTEISNRGSADSSLTSAVSTVSAGLSTEISNRGSADGSLTSRISSEEGNRSGADGSLTSRISTEESNRAVADGAFLVKSSNLSDLTNTTSARSNIGLGSVDNTADSAKSVNYANTAGTAGSASAVAWSNVSSKPNWAGTYFYDAGSGTYITHPIWSVDIARFGDFGDSTNRQFNVWGSFVMNPYYTDGDASIDPRAGIGYTTTSSMIIVKFHVGGGAYTQGFYLPGADDPSQPTPTIGTTVHFVNNGWNHYTVIGRRSDYPGPCGYNLSWPGTYNIGSATFEDFHSATFVFAGTFWILTAYM